VGVARSGAGRHRLSAYLGTQELSASGTTADNNEDVFKGIFNFVLFSSSCLGENLMQLVL
jgi:hypothetical protein